MLENVLVFIPTFAMMLGMLDFSVALFLRSTFQHACREGVRYAVTYQTIPGLGHDSSIKSVVQQNAMGFLAGSSGAAQIKVRYYDSETFVESAQNAPGNIIEVSVENYRWGWILPLMRTRTPLSLTARATDRMESLPSGTAAPAR